MAYFWKIYQIMPTYDPKYDPANYLHIKEHDYKAYEEMTSEYLLDDEINEIKKHNPDMVDIIIRDYSGTDTYRKIGEINILDANLRLSTFDPENLDILRGTNYIVYYRLSDIYHMKTIANTTQDINEQNRMMINIYFYMYRIAERNNKILENLKY